MVDEWKIIKDKPKLTIILLSITIIAIICIATIALSNNWIIHTTTNKIGYSTTFKSVTASEAYNLVYNSNPPIVVIDINSCYCIYKDRHMPGAIWEINSTAFYNFTSDILVYCEDENLSHDFCEDLVGHTFGSIYYLEGGIKAWENAGYNITKAELPKRTEP